MATTENNWEIIFLIIGWNIILAVGVGMYHESFDSTGAYKTPTTNCTGSISQPENCTNINNPPTGAISFLQSIVFGIGDLADQLGWVFVLFFVTIWEVILGILIYRLLRSG